MGNDGGDCAGRGRAAEYPDKGADLCAVGGQVAGAGSGIQASAYGASKGPGLPGAAQGAGEGDAGFLERREQHKGEI